MLQNIEMDGCAFSLNYGCLCWHQPFRGLSFCVQVEYGFVDRQRDPSDLHIANGFVDCQRGPSNDPGFNNLFLVPLFTFEPSGLAMDSWIVRAARFTILG